jgi:hypothetical protein
MRRVLPLIMEIRCCGILIGKVRGAAQAALPTASSEHLAAADPADDVEHGHEIADGDLSRRRRRFGNGEG